MQTGLKKDLTQEPSKGHFDYKYCKSVENTLSSYFKKLKKEFVHKQAA